MLIDSVICDLTLQASLDQERRKYPGIPELEKVSKLVDLSVVKIKSGSGIYCLFMAV